jgi:dipeptidyl aminopeptidase/acylaminoacyl peptidase
MLREGLHEQRLTSFAPAAALDAHRFTVDTAAGLTLDDWLLTPAGVDGPLPTVLLVHGGPHFTFGEMFSLDAHALCGAGFAVLYTNPRGSTGYGTAFAQACHGDWSLGPASDLHALLDHAIAEGWVDADRTGIAGNSYGGYMSAWMVGTSSRFRAAVIENPVTDLASMYYTSDIGTGYFPPQFGGAPHEVPDIYRDQSPITHAHLCRTPCLFLVGDADRRCPSAQAWAMHRVLHLNGVPSEVMVLPGCSHEGSTYGPPIARREADAALVEWFTRWL